MNLTLAEAAERAKMSLRQMMICIENGALVATSQTQDGELQIAPEDLESFLKKRSFDAFWNNDEEKDNEAVDLRGNAQSGNLRRVLTAEAVAELKIEHQILMSRVETLERLFSEFMDVEKTERTLVLEDDWKIERDQDSDKSANLVSEAVKTAPKEEDIASPSEPAAEKETPDAKVEESSAEEPAASMGNAESSDIDPVVAKKDPAHSEPSRVEADKAPEKQSVSADKDPEQDAADAKPKSAKNLLAQKLQQASAEMGGEEEKVSETVQEETQSNDDMERPIALKLAEYERRLAAAKQTATQLWH
ncbi:MAG: hypothetical protein O3A32_15980 [Proteobacteria bacterium]|nr:hypothetical protein [Pseudomonadota bacterium]